MKQNGLILTSNCQRMWDDKPPGNIGRFSDVFGLEHLLAPPRWMDKVKAKSDEIHARIAALPKEEQEHHFEWLGDVREWVNKCEVAYRLDQYQLEALNNGRQAG